MITLPSKVEIKHYNSILFSIKSLSGDIEINSDKWDTILSTFKNFRGIYFIGRRLQFDFPDIERHISYLATELLSNKHDFYEILIEVKPSNLLINRNLLEKFWSHYEYPAIIFSELEMNRNTLINLFKKREGYDAFAKGNKGVSILHRSFELDVLWIAQNPKYIDL